MRASISTWLCSSGGHAGRAGAGQEQGNNGLRLQQAAQGVVHQQPYCQVEGSPGLSPHDPTATGQKTNEEELGKMTRSKKISRKYKNVTVKAMGAVSGMLCDTLGTCCVTDLVHAV